MDSPGDQWIVTRLALLTSLGYCQTGPSSVRALSYLPLHPAKLLALLPLQSNLSLQVFYTFTNTCTGILTYSTILFLRNKVMLVV